MELTLAAVAATALTEGVRFLYAQATEILKRRRARKDAGAADQPEPLAPPPTEVFDGPVRLDDADDTVVARYEEDLTAVLTATPLVRVAVLQEPADPSDEDAVRLAEALRAILEQVYGTTITFVGESGRAASGAPVVRAHARADVVEGYLSALRAKNILSGEIEASTDVGEVKGTVVTVEVDTIGGSSRPERT